MLLSSCLRLSFVNLERIVKKCTGTVKVIYVKFIDRSLITFTFFDQEVVSAEFYVVTVVISSVCSPIFRHG